MTEVIKMIALFTVMVVVIIIEGFWLQYIIEHFNGSVSVLACIVIVATVEALTPKALTGLLPLSLFVTQCYIWLF